MIFWGAFWWLYLSFDWLLLSQHFIGFVSIRSFSCVSVDYASLGSKYLKSLKLSIQSFSTHPTCWGHPVWGTFERLGRWRWKAQHLLAIRTHIMRAVWGWCFCFFACEFGQVLDFWNYLSLSSLDYIGLLDDLAPTIHWHIRMWFKDTE